jgi:hypothetical protein
MTDIAAKNGDRNAYDKLIKLSKDPNYKFKKNAAKAWKTIFESRSKSFYSSGFTVPWKEGVDPLQFDIDKLKNEYYNAPVNLRVALIEYIYKREDISQIRRLDFLIEVIKSDSNLDAVEYAGRFFSNKTNLKIKAMAIDYFIDWWEENREKYVDK